jgi:hypothetical protein
MRFSNTPDGADHLQVGFSLPTEDVAKPDHYNKGVAPYDVAKTMFGASGLLKYVLINAIKYTQRYPHKHKDNPEAQLADLIKARQSIDTAIELHKEIFNSDLERHG